MGTPGSGKRQPNEFIRWFAQEYAATYGLAKIQQGLWVAVDEAQARRIADAYEALPVDGLADTRTRNSYDHFSREIQQQWNFIVDCMGIALEPWTREGQPYLNSAEMRRDVKDHLHLFFYQGGDPHPLLGKTDPETGLSLNDKFRAIHDLFGHAAEGYGFGPRGEENAWLKHGHMFSPNAQRAMTTETRGQNSWTNFGRHNYDSSGNHTNRPLADRPYALQKAALLPDEYSDLTVALPQLRS